MELLRLKKRTTLAKKGHKLLKEKRDGLMQEFLALIREVKQLRSEVDKELSEALNKFTMAGAVMEPQAVRMIQNLKLYSVSATGIDKNVMGVHIPEFDIRQEESDDKYPWWATSPELDSALVYFRDVLPRLMELAAKEKAADLLAQEIEKTRRRVNALEYVLIPQLQTTSKYIQMKLEEQGRAAIVTTMKVKQSIA
jgi:V/A-type H+-transporting ATPase subunit D